MADGFISEEELLKRVQGAKSVPTETTPPAAPPIDGFISEEDLIARSQAGGGDLSADRSGQAFLNSLTFGLRPRIQAAIETGAVSGPEYEKARDEQFARDDAYRQANPGTAFAAEVVGAIPTMFIPGLGAARVGRAAVQGATAANQLTRGQQAARLAGFGPGVGSAAHEAGVLGAKSAALYGAGASREEDAGRLIEGLASAPFGYAAGQLGQRALQPLVGGMERLAELRRVGSAPEYGALSAMRRNMRADSVTPDNIRDAVIPRLGSRSYDRDAAEAALTAYGDAVRDEVGSAADRAARQAARQAYRDTMRARGATLADRTLDDQANQIINTYRRNNEIPQTLDEVAKRATGGRGQNLEWSRRAVMAQPGEGRASIVQALNERQESIIPTVRARVENTITGDDILDIEQSLIQRNRAIENRLYETARANEKPFDLRPEIDGLSRANAFQGPELRRKYQEALDLMRGEDRHTLSSYIQARTELNDMIEDSYRVNEATGTRRPTSLTGPLIELKKRLDDTVMAANPAFRTANEVARGGRSAEQALQEGASINLSGRDKKTRQILRRVSTINEEINRLSTEARKAQRSGGQLSPEKEARLALLENQRDAYRLGFSEVMQKALDPLGDYHDVSKLFLKGGRGAQRGPREVLRTMLGDEADGFMDLIENARSATSSYRSLQGSQTTPLREAIDDQNVPSSIAGMMEYPYLALTNPSEIFRRLADVAARRFQRGRDAELGQLYSRMTDDPQNFFDTLRRMEQMQAQMPRGFTAEGVNYYSAPGAFSSAINAARIQDEEDEGPFVPVR